MTEPPQDRKSYRLLIADDHEMFRGGVIRSLSLNPEFEVVAEADNGATAVEAFEAQRPDLVLLDLDMPVMRGLEALQRIREIDPDAKVLMLTTYGSEADIQDSLAAGARGYVLKDMKREPFVQLLHDVLQGRKRFSPEVAEVLADQHVRPTLTATEFRVLEAIRDGLSTKEIAKRLGVTEGTVRAHTTNLFDKLSAKRRTEAVAIALKRGLVRPN